MKLGRLIREPLKMEDDREFEVFLRKYLLFENIVFEGQFFFVLKIFEDTMFYLVFEKNIQWHKKMEIDWPFG